MSLTASERIPILARHLVSDRAKQTLDAVEKFVEEECIPADVLYQAQLGVATETRFDGHPQILEELKKKAKSAGLWNLFLAKGHFKEGAGFTNLEYGLMAELLGKSRIAPEELLCRLDLNSWTNHRQACNCNAPDTGNMELLAKYGNDSHKKQWLAPLLNGEIRSAFLMTEPNVASSDATNIELTILKDGDSYVLNGSKWWSSGAGDKRCQLYLVMGKTAPDHPQVHKRQSVIIVPASTPGITVERMLSVFGYDDAPEGHGHITFNNVRVPVSNMVLGEGRGFEIVQGRLGPGRIHHAMRSIGSAEKALEYFVARANDPKKKPFGKVLGENGITLERLATCRIEIDAARLVVLNAAVKIDELSAKSALVEIAEAKVLIPQTLLRVVDRAIQSYGGAGVSQDTPLAYMYAAGRTMRLVDGPDEVHMLQLGRNENKRGKVVLEKLETQMKAVKALFERFGTELQDPLKLNRVSKAHL